jgi:hypothetical protein
MTRKLLLLALAGALALAAPAAADQVLLGFNGFDYDSALATSTHYLDVGDQYHSLGYISSVDPGLLGGYVDFGVNEYTYYMYGLKVDFESFGGGSLTAGLAFSTSGRTRYYEDPISGGTHGVYGTNPANGTAPSTFTDGTVALGGKTYNMVITYDFDLCQGDFSANMDLDEGTDPFTYIPESQRPGWILGGLSGTNALGCTTNTSIPAGYDHQVSGECRRPNVTPSTHKTWGAIKALYR